MSFRLVKLGDLVRELAVEMRVQQVRSLDATVLEKATGFGGLKILKAVSRPVVEESALDLGWGCRGRRLRWRILVVEERVAEGVW